MADKKNEDRAATAMIVMAVVLWIVAALLSLGFTATIIWGIIEVVQWLTTK